MVNWANVAFFNARPHMGVAGYSASITTCLDWAVNEFSISGVPVMIVFDNILLIPAVVIAAITAKGAGV